MMAIAQRTIEYVHEGIRHIGFMAFDDSKTKPLPGIMIAPTWAGRDRFACAKALKLAELGYAAFAIDMYGESQVGVGAEACAKLMTPLVEDRALLKDRINKALDIFKDQSEVDRNRVAAMGFCFGGLCVLDLARSGASLQGVISFHGIFTPPESGTVKAIIPKILVMHGFDDPMATPDQAIALGHELSQHQADWQIHLYGQTAHAFTNPLANDPGFGTVYNETADMRSWESLLDFLKEVLK